MENFGLKVATSVLSALLLIFGTKTFIEMNVGHHAEKAGYTLPGGEAPAAEAKAGEPAKEAAPAPAAASKDGAAKDAAPAKEAAAPAKDAAAPAAGGGSEVVALLSKASADNGKSIFNKCKSCHVAEKGKAPTVGPNLWGVVNRPKGSYPGFNYSEAMKAKGGDWSFENLGEFLHNPKGYVQGTKMVFNGLPTAADEADVIAYLATLADAPVPLPK